MTTSEITERDNIYSAPEKFGLTIVDSMSMTKESYQFDILLVITDGKNFYAARDSGCSCPSPFENIQSVNKLVHLTGPASLDELVTPENDFFEKNYWDDGYPRKSNGLDARFIEMKMKLLKAMS